MSRLVCKEELGTIKPIFWGMGGVEVFENNKEYPYKFIKHTVKT